MQPLRRHCSLSGKISPTRQRSTSFGARAVCIAGPALSTDRCALIVRHCRAGLGRAARRAGAHVLDNHHEKR
eukprot:scaffold111283_cov29-Tisochrysis_lutea.AAC.1